MGVVRSTVAIGFQGEGGGVGELTWGQQEIWHTIQRTGRTLNIGGALPMPPGTSVERITRMLRFWISRHPGLRTRICFMPEPRQVVAESGEIALHVLDVDDADDGNGAGAAAAAAAAEALRVEFEAPAFDYPNEWPVRMGVVRQAGEVTHMVVQYCHLAVDGGGIDAMVRDLAHLEAGAPYPPVPGPSPLELARIQATAAGRRASDKSLRYWEGLLRRIPTQRFPAPGEGLEPRFWELCCYSPALHLALQRIAARTETNTTHVLLAAYAVALARVTGIQPSVAQTVVSNRFRPGLGDLVGQISQPGLCVVEVGDVPFDEVVGRAWKAVTAGALHGYFHPAAHRAMLDRLSQERGERIDVSCFVNDRRRDAELEPGAPPPTDDELRAALARTTLHWDRKQPVFDATLFLQVDSGPDLNAPPRPTSEEQTSERSEQSERSEPEPAVFLAVWADTRHLAPPQVERFVRAMEEIAVQAALDPLAATGVRQSADFAS
ncbi:condensation protein [Actinospica durhamensis]|uniref:Condensation protein n=1 Tax=Actinospica durhamensis TaxID=1508375 RepID=A0A941ER14_9ACTN|nr:condensation domain-containing protein [Actinospica durhamensis]MBR7835786.1 condensation protein [Actinospica durhamensis]